MRPIQNGWYFADDIFKCIFLNENVGISNIISLRCISEGLIDGKSALFQVMAWHLLGAKSLPEPMITQLLGHVLCSLDDLMLPAAVDDGN